MTKKVLLLGSYGQTNLGDDLLFHNFLALLVEQGYDEIHINVADETLLPADTMSQFGYNIITHETYKTSAIDWLKIIKRVDVIIYGGGTIFKDLYSSTGRGKHAVVARIALFNLAARVFGKQTWNLFIGIGSLPSRTGRLLTKLALSLSHRSFFRDQPSYDFARTRLHIKGDKIRQSTDAIFLGQQWGVSKLTMQDLPTGQQVVGVNLLSDIPDWVDRDLYINTCRDFLNDLIDAGNHIVFIPFQEAYNEQNDKDFMKHEFMSQLPDKHTTLLTSVQLADLAPIFNRIDYFIGMRFHSLLVAALFRCPFLSIEYDTKCTRLMKDMHYPFTIGMDDLTLDSVKSAFADLERANVKDTRKTQQKYTGQQEKRMKASLKELWI